MRIIHLDILEISYILLYKYNLKRVRINTIFNSLKFKNPSFYKNLSFCQARQCFIELFPIYKNKRKKCRYFKISKKTYNAHIQHHSVNLRPQSDIKEELYDLIKPPRYV